MVKDMQRGVSALSIAERLSVGLSAVYRWKKHTKKLEESPPTHHKTRPSRFPSLDKELLEQFLLHSRAGDIISDKWLLLKAQELHAKSVPQIVSTDANGASVAPFGRGFIRRWKQRHEIWGEGRCRHCCRHQVQVERTKNA